MNDWKCLCRWSREIASDPAVREPEPFSLPSPLPQWPQGGGFAMGMICIGELEIVEITKFQSVWSYLPINKKSKGATFYKPIGIPEGFFILGYYGQPNDKPLQGFVLVARDGTPPKSVESLAALQKPLDYTLIWSSDDWKEDNHDGCGYFWHPFAPENYNAVGFVVTRTPAKPSLGEVRCVRSDLTDTCEIHNLILTSTESTSSETLFRAWKTRSSHRGMWGKGVSVGTFFCSTGVCEDQMNISCLKNFDSTLRAMPNPDQIHTLIKHFGPTLFFHPKERYLPSSVSWFFKNGAILYRRGHVLGEDIDAEGSNLPTNGDNDGEYWIDLPDGDDETALVKRGDIESAELYVHVKPALGGAFTDVVMWVFCPFNGPATIKIGMLNLSLSKIGCHVGDWEHFTLRISNFTGELRSVYFSQHSGGEWVDACSLEFVEGNRVAVYSSKNGHASFPHPGSYLQGSEKLGIGVRNDAARSEIFVDSSIRYRIVAAEYLGDDVKEPCWLQYMREWGPTIVYNSRSELERMIRYLPVNLRFSVENVFDKLPAELYREEGPTGPKEKNNWVGDERG